MALTLAACTLLSLGYGVLIGRPLPFVDGWLFDAAVKLRVDLQGASPPSTRVAVLAVDAKSLSHEQLQATPRALMGPIWGSLIRVLREAEAETIAFDYVLSYSGNSLFTDYDQPFIETLSRHRQHLVLGRTGGTLPAMPYLAALDFDESALGLLEMRPDADEVVREILLRFPDTESLGLAAAVTARAGIERPPTPMVGFAPRQHPESLPTYSLIDVLLCAASHPGELAARFRGRQVFIGSTLAEEDRWLSSARFLSPPTPANTPSQTPCELQPLPASVPGAQSVPGVHLHALAADSLLQGQWLHPLPAVLLTGLALLATGLGVWIGFRLPPAWILLALPLALSLLLSLQVGLLMQEIHLAGGYPMLALLLSTLAAYGTRYSLAERQRRWIQEAFCHYLAPPLVNRLAEDETGLRLDGETRTISVMFADLSGFTALSERVSAQELVQTTNRYLSLIVTAVHASGGYVDKFIGDAVMAIWGAPLADPAHEVNAVLAALDIVERVEQESSALPREQRFSVKIGLYSGEAVVGNVGSRERLNYTAIGESVNIASRMEGLASAYRCRVLLGDNTAARLGQHFLLREIDAVTVKGKTQPVRIFEPLCRDTETTPLSLTRAGRYAEALQHYRHRDFAAAENIWTELARLRPEAGPEAVMAERARYYQQHSPAADWDGVWHMTSK